MERIGHIWRIKPGQTEEYLKRHRTIWPELAELLRGTGVRHYTIYISGPIVFSHMEVDDYSEMVRRMAGDPTAIRWEQEFTDILEYPNADPETGWPERATEVWDLDANNS